ncbi:SCO1860 family LAETG-anchored protein [Streptomyces sp. MAR4 CNX-425]|uniref:SCO1860 family LAETG-anchored protein n=1 Tax=Streptomyces sp. MAR4 CNX-425 TaxID=3406343 RepID=UPI003B50171A
MSRPSRLFRLFRLSCLFRTPAAAVTAAALATGPALLLAAPAPAYADDDGGAAPARTGSAAASVLRADLDVSLLDDSVRVPVRATLNEVREPAAGRGSGAADKTALDVRVDGLAAARDGQRPGGGDVVDIARADVATAAATVDASGAEASSHLARAEVHVPGLPALSLIKVEQVTSTAVCPVDGEPEAESSAPGSVSVLGKRVTLTAGGEPTAVTVPGVGEVSLGFSQTRTTRSTASAAALRLTVSVNPLKLNVAAVEGEVTLVEAECATPAGGEPGERPQGDAEPTGDARPADAADAGDAADPAGPAPGEQLAETGGSSATPYLVGGAAVLVGLGLTGVALARGRARG